MVYIFVVGLMMAIVTMFMTMMLLTGLLELGRGSFFSRGGGVSKPLVFIIRQCPTITHTLPNTFHVPG